MNPITKSERKALLKAVSSYEHAKLGRTLSQAIEFERRKKDSYLIKVENKPLK
jgi:hypothetical protein